MLYEKKPDGFNAKVSVAGCFVEQDGRILLLKRNASRPQGGTFGAPSGKLEAGETQTEAAARELFEETGLAVRPEDLGNWRSFYVAYPEYTFTYSICRLPLPRRPEIRLRAGEHDEFLWATPAEALALKLIPDMAEVIRICYHL